MKTGPRSWLILALIVLSSCGYRFGACQEEREVMIPYVKGDDFGWMTGALVRRVNQESQIRYSNAPRDLELRVCLNPPRDENVGFWFAPQKNGGLSNIIVPIEAKVTLTARVELYDCQTGSRVVGPYLVSTFLEYDFNSDLTNINDHEFSLGQLEMHNIAKNFAVRSLYDRLAEKIVDTAKHAW